MGKLTEAMKAMIASQQSFHATISKEGIPNIGPKRSTQVYDDNTLMFNEGTGGQTYKNILDGSKVATAMVDREKMDGYRFLSKPEVLVSGKIYDKAAEFSLSKGMPKPKAVILLHIEKVYTLKAGPEAGKLIDG